MKTEERKTESAYTPVTDPEFMRYYIQHNGRNPQCVGVGSKALDRAKGLYLQARSGGLTARVMLSRNPNPGGPYEVVDLRPRVAKR